MKLRIPQATAKGYIEVEEWGVFDYSYPESKTRRGRVQEGANSTHHHLHRRDIFIRTTLINTTMSNEKTIDTSKEQRYKKLCDEYKELSGKITRLDAFVNDLFFKTTVPDEEERVFMLGQLFHMRGYRDNLKERISKLWEQIKSDRTQDDEQPHHCGQDADHELQNLKSLFGKEVVALGNGMCEGCPQDRYGAKCVKMMLAGGTYICLAPKPQEDA